MVFAINSPVISAALGPGPAITVHQNLVIEVLLNPENHPRTDIFADSQRLRPVSWMLGMFQSFGEPGSDPLLHVATETQQIADILVNHHYQTRASAHQFTVTWGGDDAPEPANENFAQITGCEVLIYVTRSIALQEHIPMSQLVSSQGLVGLRRAIEIAELLDDSYQRLMEVAESHGLIGMSSLAG